MAIEIAYRISVFGRSLGAIDDEKLNGTSDGIQTQFQLLLKRYRDAWIGLERWIRRARKFLTIANIGAGALG